jgi:hypothetical protein
LLKQLAAWLLVPTKRKQKVENGIGTIPTERFKV